VNVDPDAVRQARLKAGLSLAQVAGSELSRQAVHLIERGKIRPTMATLRTIADRLGVPVYLLQAIEDHRAMPADDPASELESLCELQQYPKVVERAQQILDGGPTAYVEAVARLYLGRALDHLVRPNEALEQLRRAREIIEAVDPWLAAEALEWEAGALYLKEDAGAVALGQEALRRYQALARRRPEIEARMLEHLATFLVRQGEFSRAMTCYLEALQVTGEVVNLVRMGRIYHGLSRCYSSQGDLPKAIDLASKAVALYGVENDLRPRSARTDLLRVEHDLGEFHLRLGNLGRAEELFLSTLKRHDEAGLERMKGRGLVTMAELRQMQGRFSEAADLIFQAVDLAQRFDEQMTLGMANRQLGLLHAAQGEHELADESFERALDILAEAGLDEARAECLAMYRKVLSERGDTERLERFAG
jgi:tetratricopeptide (TPR) repeat protein